MLNDDVQCPVLILLVIMTPIPGFFLFIINISYRNWNSSYNLKSLSLFSCFVDFFLGGGGWLNYFLVLGMIDILYYCDIRNICFVCDFITLIIIRPMVTQKSNSVTRRNLGVLTLSQSATIYPAGWFLIDWKMFTHSYKIRNTKFHKHKIQQNVLYMRIRVLTAIHYIYWTK